jgi:hypothetical protein
MAERIRQKTGKRKPNQEILEKTGRTSDPCTDIPPTPDESSKMDDGELGLLARIT